MKQLRNVVIRLQWIQYGSSCRTRSDPKCSNSTVLNIQEVNINQHQWLWGQNTTQLRSTPGTFPNTDNVTSKKKKCNWDDRGINSRSHICRSHLLQDLDSLSCRNVLSHSHVSSLGHLSSQTHASSQTHDEGAQSVFVDTELPLQKLFVQFRYNNNINNQKEQFEFLTYGAKIYKSSRYKMQVKMFNNLLEQNKIVLNVAKLSGSKLI